MWLRSDVPRVGIHTWVVVPDIATRGHSRTNHDHTTRRPTRPTWERAILAVVATFATASQEDYEDIKRSVTMGRDTTVPDFITSRTGLLRASPP